ncbi:MAG: TonB-dependent receptor [Pseudomonadota bacterium]
MNRNKLFAGAAAIAIVAPLGAQAQDESFEVEGDEIIVTASPLERTVGETILNTSIISGEELQRRVENSIGETLRREPGVSSTFFGPGASRPVIRGLAGDRIRVLDAGIGSIDASATSPDHAVAVEPATAQKIEIVRGPSTLLYGSSAAGGVVNVFNGRIPSVVPEDGLDGSVRVGTSTVDDGFETSGGFDLKLGDFGDGALVFHGDGFYRDAEDYDIPGFAESARLRALEEAEEGPEEEGHEEEEEVFGTAENSAFETKGGSAGLSFVFDNGFFGVSATAIDTTYGIPGGHGHEEGEEEGEEEEEEEGGVTIDLEQRRLDVNGEIEGDFGLFQKAKLRLGYADYEHVEIEPSGEVGTNFSNVGWEGRFELVSKTRNLFGGELNGATGIQYRKRDFSAIGEEAFVPPTETDQFGLFALKELSTGPWRLELGGRYEHTSHEVQETGVERDFDGFSVSGGAGFQANDNVFFGVTGFRTERAPATEELFSNGPHLATNAFEIGDPDLNEEVARGVEATARFTTERFSGSISGYYTSYRDFIFEAATGEEEDGLPVFQFFAEDAQFRGFEAQVTGELFRASMFDIHGDASVDYVRATTDAGGNNNLPRIPPLSGIVGLEARSKHVDLRAELEYAADQDDVTEFELPTDGYEVFNAFVTVRPFTGTPGLALRLSANNLTDEDVRLHTSFLKDLAPLPGRNFRISLQGTF